MESSALVCRQTLHDGSHLLICVYPEALLLGYACQLHVLRIQLLLHHLLQGLQHQRLSICQGERL